MAGALLWQQQIGSQWPDPHQTPQFLAAVRSRELYMLDYVKAAVASLPVYYFSQSTGSDSNAGTIGSPMQTMAKANSMPGIQALFLAGDEWNETTGITLTAAGKIGVYGSGPKPFFNCFSVKIPAASFSLTSGTTWACTVASQLGMIRIQGRGGNAFPMLAFIPGTSIGNNLFCFAWATSLANCEASPFPSWFQSGATVYVNLAGTGLSSPPAMEGQIGQSVENAGGVSLNADGTWCDGIRADGWGITPASAGWGTLEATGLQSFTSSNQVSLFTRSDSFMGGSHTYLAYSFSSGGIVVAKNCRSGWTTGTQPTSAATWVNFAQNGGQEAYFFECETLGGMVPYGTVGGFVQQNGAMVGQAWIAHTGVSGTYPSCYISRGCRTRTDAQNWPLGGVQPQVAVPSSWASATAFCIGYRAGHEIPQSYVPPQQGPSVASHLLQCFVNGVVNLQCDQVDAAGSVSGNPFYCDAAGSTESISCNFNIRALNGTLSAINFGNLSGASFSMVMHGCGFRLSGQCASVVNWQDYPVAGNVTEWKNCTIAIESEGSTFQWNSLSSNGTLTLAGNAYFPNLPTADASAVLLPTFPTGNEIPAPTDGLYQVGVSLGNYPDVQMDVDNNLRILPVTIGPREVNPGLSVTQQQTVKFGYETGRTLTFRSYTQGSSPTLVQTISLTESPAGSSNYVTSTALTLGTPITYTITDSVSGVVGTGVM